jgi:histidinol-phosphate aminotransferase
MADAMPGPRDEIVRLDAYSWETPTWEIARRYGLRVEDVVRMDLNTSPYNPSRWLHRLVGGIEGVRVNEYPDTSYRELREMLSSYTGVEPESIMVCNGADEAIDIVCKAYLDGGREAIISSPTYSYFRVSAEIMGSKVVSIPRLPDFADNIEGILASVNSRTSLIFLCSPNNPTGNTVDRMAVRKILDEFDGVVVIDEAYFEFCGETFTPLLSRYGNLVVVRTFSKAWSMAGARVGYLMAGEEVMKYLNKVRPPNSLSIISLALAAYALRDKRTMEGYVRRIVDERDRMYKELSNIEGLTVYRSKANFLLIRFHRADAGRVHEELMRDGLVLRRLTNIPALSNCLRMTISTPKYNNLLLRKIRKLV